MENKDKINFTVVVYDPITFTHEVIEEIYTNSLYEATMAVQENYFLGFSCALKNNVTGHLSIIGH